MEPTRQPHPEEQQQSKNDPVPSRPAAPPSPWRFAVPDEIEELDQFQRAPRDTPAARALSRAPVRRVRSNFPDSHSPLHQVESVSS